MTAHCCQTGEVTDIWVENARTRQIRLWLEGLAIAGYGLLSVLAAGSNSAWAAVVALTLVVAVAVRRFWLPAAVLLASAAGLAQAVAWSAFSPFADLLYAPLCYSLGAHRDPRVRRFGLIASLVAVVAAAAAIPLNGPMSSRSTAEILASAVACGAMAAVVSVGGWSAGFMRFQSRTAVEDQVAARLAEAEKQRLADAFQQEQERNRIATDMHDVVAHSWAVVAAQADGARYSLRNSPDQAEQALAVIGDTARSAITDLRRILHELRHYESGEGMVGPEQQQVLLDRMTASGMDLRFTETGRRPESTLLTLTAHRLLGEALTNALKHGDLRVPVTAQLSWVNGFTLDVTNEFASPTAAPGTGHGLIGMAERARLAGGTLTSRREGDRWVLHAQVPPPASEPS